MSAGPGKSYVRAACAWASTWAKRSLKLVVRLVRGAFSVAATGLAKAEAKRPLRRTMGESFILFARLLRYRGWALYEADE